MSATDEWTAKVIAAGKEIDLRGCVYGPPHWRGAFVDTTPAYYGFLAGLVRVERCARVLEVGTHYGGATQAMARGAADDVDLRLVTLDVTRLNEETLGKDRRILRLQGDSLADATVERALAHFDRHVDLLFIDTVHDFWPTWTNLAVYGNALKPRFIVFDDIRLTPGMRRLWREVTRRARGDVVDVSELVDRSDSGFGVLRCEYPMVWQEPPRAIRHVWGAKRAVLHVVPYEVRERVKRVLGRT